MELHELLTEVEGFKQDVIKHRDLVVKKMAAFSEVKTDTRETREHLNRLMSYIKGLNITVNLLEHDVKDVQRKILNAQIGEDF